MERKLLVTADGSHTLSLEQHPFLRTPVTYHSIHGAVQESLHVYIEAGLRQFLCESPVSIFEMGFGTGLNALLTLLEARRRGVQVFYQAIELFPLTAGETRELNYPSRLTKEGDLVETQALFERMHDAPWNENVALDPAFTLHKSLGSITGLALSQLFHVVYYDAFAPAAQPELWTRDIFERMFSLLRPGGVLVTYCSKGEVRRALAGAGFAVEKLKGPPGKREMIRAVRPGG